MPSEIVDMERKIRNLEVEKEALSLEMKDISTKISSQKSQSVQKKRVSEIESELASLKETYNALKAEWDQERQLLTESKTIKEQIAACEHDAMIAEKDTDYNKVAELRYGKIPALQKQLEMLDEKIEQARASGQLTVRDVVMPEDIAIIIAKWTGIPASKLVEKDADKLLHLEDWLSAHVIGQKDAVNVVASAIKRSRA